MITYIVLLSSLYVATCWGLASKYHKCEREAVRYPLQFDDAGSSFVHGEEVSSEGPQQVPGGPPGIGGYAGMVGERRFYLSVSWQRSVVERTWQQHGRVSMLRVEGEPFTLSACMTGKSCAAGGLLVESARLMKLTQGSRFDVEILLRDLKMKAYDVVDVVGVYQDGQISQASSGVQFELVSSVTLDLGKELLNWASVAFPEPGHVGGDLQQSGRVVELPEQTTLGYNTWATVADRLNLNSFKGVRRAWALETEQAAEERWQSPGRVPPRHGQALEIRTRSRGKVEHGRLLGLPVPPFLPQPSYVLVSLTTMLLSAFVWLFLFGSAGRKAGCWARQYHQTPWVPVLPANGTLIGTRWSLLVLQFDVVLATTNVCLGLGLHREALPRFWHWRGGGTEGVCVVLGLAQLGIALGIGQRSLASNGSFFLWTPHIVVILTTACVLSTHFNVLVAAATLLLFQTIILRDIINNVRCPISVIRPSNEEILVILGIIVSRSVAVYTLASTPYLRIISIVSLEAIAATCFVPQIVILFFLIFTRLVATGSDVAPQVMALARAKRRYGYSQEGNQTMLVNRVSLELFGLKLCNLTCGSVRLFYVHTQNVGDDIAFRNSFHEEIPSKLRSEAEPSWKSAWEARHNSVIHADSKTRREVTPEGDDSDEVSLLEDDNSSAGTGGGSQCDEQAPSSKAESVHSMTSTLCSSFNSEGDEPCCPICYLPLLQIEDYSLELQQDVLPQVPSAWRQCCVTRCGHVFHFPCLEQWVLTSTSRGRDIGGEPEQNGWSIDWIRDHLSDDEEDLDVTVTCPVCRSTLPDIGRSADNINVVCSTVTISNMLRHF